MRKLEKDWFFSGLLDFEYKKYIFLAYEQFARQELGNRKLYPLMTDLQAHYQELISYRGARQVLKDSFPKEISKEDLKSFKITYKSIVTDADFLQEVEAITEFALPRVDKMLATGRELYESIESKISVEPLGISPLNPMEGFFFISEYQRNVARLFSYQITIFETAQENLRGIKTSFVEDMPKSPAQSFESLKIEALRKHASYPNPATFLLSVSVPCPFEETLMPIAKRTLVRYVSNIKSL